MVHRAPLEIPEPMAEPAPDCPWGLAPVIGIDDFCEAIDRCGWVLQPWGAGSALAFVPVALWITAYARRVGQPSLHLLAGSAWAMAIGTVAQHTTGSWSGMLLDHAGMQASNVAMALVGLRRLTRTSWDRLLAGGAAVWIGLVALTAIVGDARRDVVLAGMVPCALLELTLYVRHRTSTRLRWLVAGWLAFGAAIVAWELDRSPAWCDPHGPVQLHALWHVLCAVALGVWAVYYRQFETLRGA